MDASDLRGMAVVTLAGAERLGRVGDVVFETEPLRARAIRILTDSGSRLIALEDVRSFGADAMVADDAATAARSDPDMSMQHLSGLGDLGQLKVVDEAGTFIGEVNRVEADFPSGTVSGLEVRRGGWLGVGGETVTLHQDQVVSIGDELMTVRQLAGQGG